MSQDKVPELVVKFWPPSITARGKPAINAIRRPLAFALYSKPFVTVALAITAVISGGAFLSGPFLKQLMGF